jgi:hypothetical protein
MDKRILTANEFKILAIEKRIPENFVVNEEVDLTGNEFLHVVISKGTFEEDVFIRNGSSNGGFAFIKCNFNKRLSIQNFNFDGHLSFTDCIVSDLDVLASKISKNFIFTDTTLFGFSIAYSSWEKAFVEDYKVARVLELSKQGIYISRDNIIKG